MAEELPYKILMDDSLAELKSKMSVNPYTDKQLHRAAAWYVSPILELASHLGVINESQVSVASFTTANLFARTIMPEFIAKGLLSIQAIDRYMDHAEKVYQEAMNDVQEPSPE